MTSFGVEQPSRRIRNSGKLMAGLIWKKIVAKYDGRDITAQYARDGAYVRVSLPGKAEERMKHRKQRAEPLARGLLIQMAAEIKK